MSQSVTRLFVGQPRLHQVCQKWTKDTLREEKEIEEVEECSPLSVDNCAQMVKEDLEPYELEFNECNKRSQLQGRFHNLI